MTELSRQLSLTDAVFIGLAAMLGAGIFAAIAPALTAAGNWVWLSLLLAAVVAYCNAVSSAQLAACHPQAGGTYLYARERLHPLAGFIAGACFLVGKTASGAVMALTFAHYLLPAYAKPAALLALALLTALNLLGIAKTALVSRLIVVMVIAGLLAIVALCLSAPTADWRRLLPSDSVSPAGLLPGAAIWFFAFAGYARLATLAEEVREPRRVLTRAIPLSLTLVLGLYLLVSLAALSAAGPSALAASAAPLATAVEAAGFAALAPAVRLLAAIACLGVLIALIAGISRTLLAMSRNRDLPGFFEHIEPRRQVPRRAELTVALAIGIAITSLDVYEAIGFSAFCVLLYYALTNASALKLSKTERVWPRALSLIGLVGCLLLAFSLPGKALLWGGLCVSALTVYYLIRKNRHGY